MVTAGSERRHRHIRHYSALLLVAMAALLSYCGWIVAEWEGILWSLLGGITMLVLARRAPPDFVLQAIGARPVARWEAPMLYEILDALCAAPVSIACRVSARSANGFPSPLRSEMVRQRRLPYPKLWCAK
jgi:hypothetical protein